jgi:hypothetical protein
MGTKKNVYRISWKRLKERDHWEDLEVGGRKILKFILEK